MGGVAYFLLGTCLLNSASIGPDSIASFDLATEEWRPTMAGPLSSSGSSKLLYHKHRHEFRLAKLNGCLLSHSPSLARLLDEYLVPSGCR
jgi:hypothetical protein